MQGIQQLPHYDSAGRLQTMTVGPGIDGLFADSSDVEYWEGRQTGSRCRQQSYIDYRRPHLREYRHYRSLFVGGN